MVLGMLSRGALQRTAERVKLEAAAARMQVKSRNLEEEEKIRESERECSSAAVLPGTEVKVLEEEGRKVEGTRTKCGSFSTKPVNTRPHTKDVPDGSWWSLAGGGRGGGDFALREACAPARW